MAEGVDRRTVVLERSDRQSWTPLTPEKPWVWWDPEYDGSQVYHLVDEEGSLLVPLLVPTRVEATLEPDHASGMYHDGERVSLDLTITTDSAAPELSVLLVTDDDTRSPLYGNPCDDELCWSKAAAPLQERISATTLLDVPTFPVEAQVPTITPLVALTGLELNDGTFLTVERAEASLHLTGLTLAWGDLHAHSNLSNDGCEDPDLGCADRGSLAGEDFFQQARSRDLDFAAITDHAEYTDYCPSGSEGPCYDIWEQTLDLVAEAEAASEGSDFVPILGYEWTHPAAAEDGGGHRTVLLGDVEACEDYRVASSATDSYVKEQNGETYLGPTPVVAESFDALWEALESAASSCDPVDVIVFPHHSALTSPAGTNWTRGNATPHPDYEPVIEVFSEHASSECSDEANPDCDWHLPEGDAQYKGETGSVQAALSQGYLLGFVGGTDAHDGRPGSVEDGGSCTARWFDSDHDGEVDSLRCHDWGGGLTGLYLAGDLSRQTLFETLRARRSLATSGPRLPVRVLAHGAGGGLYLPGETVPSSEASPLRVVVSVEQLLVSQQQLTAIQLVRADGSLAAETDARILDTDVELAAGEALYVRLLLQDDEDEAQRVVVSPFFGV